MRRWLTFTIAWGIAGCLGVSGSGQEVKDPGPGQASGVAAQQSPAGEKKAAEVKDPGPDAANSRNPSAQTAGNTSGQTTVAQGARRHKGNGKKSDQAAPTTAAAVSPKGEKEPSEFTLSSEVELVPLDVSVKKGDGGFASGLTKDNFKVFEDGKPQTISAFSAQDIPVTVGLVVDNSGSVRPKRPEIVTAALTLVQESHPQDEVFVVNFNDKVTFGLPPDHSFSDNANQLRQALLGNPVRGKTSLYDGMKAALLQLNHGTRDKKTLVLISDGGDNASETTAEDVFRLAEESTATIYTIGIYNPEDKDKNPGFLKRLANVTGGEFFEPGNLSNLVPVCQKIAKDIRNRYTLAYSPENRSFDGKVRKIQVVATSPDGGKLNVRTRTHYVAARDEVARSHHKHD